MIHVYMGKGKGKTSAAIGLAIRAAGAGKKVVFAQFMKGDGSSELNILKKLDNLTVLTLSRTYPFTWEMTLEDRENMTKEHDAMLEQILKIHSAGKADVFILDEITYPVYMELAGEEIWNQVLTHAKADPDTEWVMTGQEPSPQMLLVADYITQMDAVRHPFDRGVAARKGIEF